MTLKSLAIGILATTTAAAAVETHVASIEVIKYVGAICGALYAVGKVVSAGLTWANHSVKVAVREEINKKFGTLPCVRMNPTAPECPEE